jgi:hypothetical protein
VTGGELEVPDAVVTMRMVPEALSAAPAGVTTR